MASSIVQTLALTFVLLFLTQSQINFARCAPRTSTSAPRPSEATSPPSSEAKPAARAQATVPKETATEATKSAITPVPTEAPKETVAASTKAATTQAPNAAATDAATTPAPKPAATDAATSAATEAPTQAVTEPPKTTIAPGTAQAATKAPQTTQAATNAPKPTQAAKPATTQAPAKPKSNFATQRTLIAPVTLNLATLGAFGSVRGRTTAPSRPMVAALTVPTVPSIVPQASVVDAKKPRITTLNDLLPRTAEERHHTCMGLRELVKDCHEDLEDFNGDCHDEMTKRCEDKWNTYWDGCTPLRRFNQYCTVRLLKVLGLCSPGFKDKDCGEDFAKMTVKCFQQQQLYFFLKCDNIVML